MLCVIQINWLVLGFYADNDNPNNGHLMSLSRSNRLELCRIILAYLLTDGLLALTETQTLQVCRKRLECCLAENSKGLDARMSAGTNFCVFEKVEKRPLGS
jgi:hypothetical protein